MPWVTPKDISRLSRREFSNPPECVTELGLAKSSAVLLPAGAVLLSSRAPIGLLAIAAIPMATNQGFKSLISGADLDNRFLYYALRRRVPYIQHRGSGATFKEVSKSVVSEIPIAFPKNLKEQRRIADILDKADDIRRKRESVLGSVDELIRSKFVARFGTPQTNLRSLPTAPIKVLGRVVTGNTPPRKDPENYGDEIEWIKSDNINTPSHFLTPAEEQLSAAGRRLGRTAPAGSTLVTCIAGSPSVIGNAALADREVAFNQQINAVIPDDQTDPFFLYCQFLVAKALIQASSTNSMKGMVSKGTFQEIEFLRPSPEEQIEFGGVFCRVNSLARRLENDHKASEQLFGSLAQRAFRGEL